MSVKVKTDVFTRFLNLVALKGDVENTEALAHGDAKFLGVIAVCKTSVMALKGKLAGSYDELGDIGLDDTNLLKKFVNIFNGCDEIELKRDRNKLVITAPNSDTKASALLREPAHISTVLPEQTFDSKITESLGNEFTLKADQVKQIVKHFDAIGTKDLVLKGKGKKVFLELDNNSNELVTSFPVDVEVKDFEVRVSQIIIDLFTILNADITVSMKTGKAIYVRFQDGDLDFEYLVARKEK